MKISKNRIYLQLAVFFSLTIIGFYLLNLYTGIAHDDYLFKFIVNKNRLADTRVETISDIIWSMKNHYYVSNGRILLNGLAQLFLMLDNKLWFDIANTLVFGLFQFLLLKRSTALSVKSVNQYLLLIIFLWFLIPVPNQTILWLDGSMNYLWGMTIVLLFLNLFDKLNLKEFQVKTKYLPLILLFGFIGGFTHEVITIGISGALIIAVLKNFKKYKKSSLILIFGFLLGTFIMVISPGNMNRLAYSSLENASLFDMIVKRCIRFMYFTFTASRAFWMMIILFAVLYIKDRNGLKEVYKKQELLLHSIFISMGFIFLAGAPSHRAFFGVSVFSIIIMLSVANKYFKLVFSNKNNIVYVILSVIVIIEFTQVTFELRTDKMLFDKDEVNWFKSDDSVFVLREKNKNRFTIHDDPSDAYFGQNNRTMNLYYGKEFMMFIPPDLYQNVYKSNNFLVEQNLLNTESLKKTAGNIKLYKTPKNNFLICKVADSISKKISDGAYVKYKSNKVIEINNSGFANKIKSFVIGNNQLDNISSEISECFVLPTSHGNYVVLTSPSVIPFENLEEIVIFPTRNDANPILIF